MSARRNPFSFGMFSNPDLKSHIDQAIDNTLKSESQGPTYFVRPAGSFVVGQSRDKTDVAGGAQIASWLKNLSGWKEVTDEVRAMGAGFGQVRYFQTQVPAGYTAYEGVLLWGELTPAQKATVYVQQAHHAANAEELVTADIPLKQASVISILVGAAGNPHEEAAPGTQIIYTWYPGRITPFLKNENLQEKLDNDTLDYYATVKSLIPPVTAKTNGLFDMVSGLFGGSAEDQDGVSWQRDSGNYWSVIGGRQYVVVKSKYGGYTLELEPHSTRGFRVGSFDSVADAKKAAVRHASKAKTNGRRR